MKNLLIKSAFFFLLITVSLNGKAQLGENRVIITRGFEPTLNDASKINVSPKMDDTVYVVPAFSYSITDSKLPTPFKINPISPAKLVGEPLDKLYSNYVIGGMGTQVSPYFEYFYSNTRSKNLAYGAHLKHFSAAGEIKDYAYPGFSTNLAEIFASKLFKHSKIEANTSYFRDVVHFYGYQPLDVDSGLALPSDKENAQNFNRFDINTRFKSIDWHKSKIEYDLGIKYRYFNTKYKNLEHTFVFDYKSLWKVNPVSQFDNQKIGVSGDVVFLSNKLGSLESNNNYVFAIIPQYQFTYKALTAEIAVIANVYNDSAALIKFAPKIDFKLEAISKILYFDFALKGGVIHNSINDLSFQNPFLADTISLEYSKNALKLCFGLNTSLSKELNFGVHMIYDKWENAPFFVTDYSIPLKNKFNVVYDDYELLQFNADLSFQSSERFLAILSANYYSYNMTAELYAWHKPDFDVHLYAKYNIQNKFILTAELVANGKSMAADTANAQRIGQTIKPWVDASIGIEYRYNTKLGFFVNFNNVTASKYYRWYYYPSYRFNLLAGFKFVF